MNFLKLLLLLGLILVGGYALFWVFGILFSLIWYIALGLLLLGGGYVAYRALSGGNEEDDLEMETPILNDGVPTGISEFQGTDRVLEAYKEEANAKKDD